MADAPGDVSDGDAGNESGDEAVAADLLGNRETKKRNRQDRQLLKSVVHPPSGRRILNQKSRSDAYACTYKQSESDLLGDELRPESGRPQSARSRSTSDEYRHERNRDPVIETTLHVQGLTNPHRHAGTGDHCLAQRGIGRCQHRRNQRCLPHTQAIEEDNRRNQTAGDRERHADSEQPGGNCSVATEDSKVDARGIAEEHNDQCDLCDCLDQRVLEAEVHHIEARASDQQAESDKDHWAGDNCA